MAQLAEHVIGNDEVPGPNPGSSSKKQRTSKEVLCFLSKPTGLVYHQPERAVYHCRTRAVYIITQSVYFCRLDDIQLLAKLMICNSCGIDDIQCFALILFDLHLYR